MLKKILVCLQGLAVAAVLASCAARKNESVIRAENWQPHISLPGTVVVCRGKQCAPAQLSMSREYVYNSLLHLLDNNSQNKMLPCTADPKTRVCTEEYIALPITVGITPAYMYINDARITDVSASLNKKTLDLVLNYNVTYNGQTPVCKPSQTLIYVKNSENIIMEDAGYTCKMTTIGNTTIKTLFAVDYIDLDYGYIGGYYSIGLSGPAYGGGSGYMLLRLPKDAYPLAPELAYLEPVTEEPKQEVVQAEAASVEQTPDSPNVSSVTVPVTTSEIAQENVKQENVKQKKVKQVSKPQPEPVGVQVFPIPTKK